MLPIFERALAFDASSSLLLYAESNPGDKFSQSLGPGDAENLRNKFGTSVRFLTGPLNPQTNLFFGPTRAVVSFESPGEFVKKFAPTKTAWIQVQSGGDLLVNVADSLIRADGYALMGSAWASREIWANSNPMSQHMPAVSVLFDAPFRVIGSPSLNSAVDLQFSKQEVSQQRPQKITIFEPNLVPKSATASLDRLNALRFEVAHFDTLRQIRETMAEVSDQAKLSQFILESRRRVKSSRIRLHLRAFGEPQSEISGLSSVKSILKSTAIVSFLPSFSIWEALYANVPVLVVDGNDLNSLSLRKHPQVGAFAYLEESLGYSLRVSSRESVRVWFENFTSGHFSNLQGSISPWLARVPDFMAEIYSLADELCSKR